MQATHEHFPGPWRDRIRRSAGCWAFDGFHDRDGYAQVVIRWPDRPRKCFRVHQLTYIEKHGPVPQGLVLDHFECDNRWCVNPDHVRPVSVRENTLRALGKRPLVSPSLTCSNGHDLSGGNLGTRPDGYPKCLACMRDYQRAYLARKAAKRDA